MQKNGSRILIIPSKKLDPDLLAAAVTIARVYKSRLGKKADIGFDSDYIPTNLIEIYPIKDLKFIQDIQTKSFEIKLKNKDAKIKDVKWEEVDGEIKLLITTDKGTLTQEGKVRSLGGNYETIIVIGVQKLEQIGKLYLENKELFTSAEIINIDLADDNGNFGTNNSFVKPDASSFSELAYEYLNEIGLNPAAKEATDLLSGIIWKTKNFQINIQKPSTFQACSELMNLNADLFEANKQALQTLNLSQLRYVNEIIKSVEIASDNIAWAKIYKIHLNTLNPKNMLFPLSNLLTYLKDVKVSFVLTEIDPDKTLCDIRSNQKSIRASQIAEVFGKTGSPEYANFMINLPISSAHKQLLKEIRTIMAGSFSRKSKVEEEKKEEKIEITEKTEDVKQVVGPNEVETMDENMPKEEENLTPGIQPETILNNENEEEDDDYEELYDDDDNLDFDLEEIQQTKEPQEKVSPISEVIPYSENKPSPPDANPPTMPPSHSTVPFDPLPPAQ